MKVKNVLNKLLAGVLAAGMIASTVPAMAEEAETITGEIKSSYFADLLLNTDGGEQRNWEKKLYVNDGYITGPSAYCVRMYNEFEIPNIEAAKDVKLKVYGELQTDKNTSSIYPMTEGFATHYTNGQYAETSDEYSYYKEYLNVGSGENFTIKPGNATFGERAGKINYTESGGNQVFKGDLKLDFSDKLETLKTNGGKIAFRTRGGDNKIFKLNQATLLVTYDKVKLVSVAQTELAAANTAENVEAFVEKWNGIFFDLDTKALKNMSVVYNALAEQRFTSVDDFVAAYNNTVASYAKTVKYTKPTNYALYTNQQTFNQADQHKALVNTNQYTRTNGTVGSVSLGGIYVYGGKPVYQYKLTNTDSIIDIKFVGNMINSLYKDSELKTNGIRLNYAIADGFPVSTEVKEYNADTEVYNTLSTLTSDYKKQQFTISAPTLDEKQNVVSAVEDAVLDLNSLKADLINKEKSNGSASIMVVVDNGWTSMYHNMNASYLQVTYDTSLIDADFENDVKAATTKELMGKVFDKYNEFIGADTSALINIDYVYADLAAKVASGTEYTYETLKADFDEFVKSYFVEVTYNTPNDYVLYRRAGRDDAFNGKYREGRALLNTDAGYVDCSDDPYYGRKWKMNGFNTFHMYPIMGYDLKDTQAIKNIKFNFPINQEGDECVLNYNVEKQFPIQGTAGEYMSDTETYANTVKYWETINRIGTFKQGTDNIDITGSVLNNLQKNSSNTLVMSVFSGGHGRFDWDKVKLTVTYDTTALTPNTSSNDYNVATRMGEWYRVIGNTGEAHGELTAVSNTTVEASITANKTTTEGFTVIGAAYKDGVLVNVKTATCNAMNVMGREKVRFEGLADCEYDTIRVFTLSGKGGIQPVADDVTLSE